MFGHTTDKSKCHRLIASKGEGDLHLSTRACVLMLGATASCQLRSMTCSHTARGDTDAHEPSGQTLCIPCELTPFASGKMQTQHPHSRWCSPQALDTGAARQSPFLMPSHKADAGSMHSIKSNMQDATTASNDKHNVRCGPRQQAAVADDGWQVSGMTQRYMPVKDGAHIPWRHVEPTFSPPLSCTVQCTLEHGMTHEGHRGPCHAGCTLVKTRNTCRR